MKAVVVYGSVYGNTEQIAKGVRVAAFDTRIAGKEAGAIVVSYSIY